MFATAGGGVRFGPLPAADAGIQPTDQDAADEAAMRKLQVGGRRRCKLDPSSTLH